MTLLAGTHVLKAALPKHLQDNHLTCTYRYNQSCTLKLKLRIKLVYKHDVNLINHKSTGLFGPHKALGRGGVFHPPTLLKSLIETIWIEGLIAYIIV